MDLVASLHATPKAWLPHGALAPHMDAYGAHLLRGRYAVNTTKKYIAGVAHFAHWVQQLETISHAMTLASAMRSYLRYRTICGDKVHGLMGVISSPAHWSLASLPRALAPDEVDRIIASFSSSLPSPRRGFAIVRCILDMGLRGSEVANLQLTDIDWSAGTVTLDRTKSLRQDILPLPVATGEALAD